MFSFFSTKPPEENPHKKKQNLNQNNKKQSSEFFYKLKDINKTNNINILNTNELINNFYEYQDKST